MHTIRKIFAFLQIIFRWAMVALAAYLLWFCTAVALVSAWCMMEFFTWAEPEGYFFRMILDSLEMAYQDYGTWLGWEACMAFAMGGAYLVTGVCLFKYLSGKFDAWSARRES